MTKERFREQGAGLFFGDCLYERTMPSRHFLRQLEEVVDWDAYVPKLIRLHHGGARRGHPPYDQW